jgi:hypothetical protein
MAASSARHDCESGRPHSSQGEWRQHPEFRHVGRERIGGSGGVITLDGGHNAAAPATVTSSGTIDAHGATGKGGDVKVLGDHVGLVGNALVDVSGDSGGGTALIGGDFQGKNPE